MSSKKLKVSWMFCCTDRQGFLRCIYLCSLHKGFLATVVCGAVQGPCAISPDVSSSGICVTGKLLESSQMAKHDQKGLIDF